MKTRTISVGLAALAAAFAVQAAAHDGRNLNVRHRGGPLENCAQLEIDFDGRPAARAEEQRTIPRASLSALQVPALENSGVEVVGWDRDEYLVTACKAAESQGRLEQVHMDVQGGRVTVRGPESEDWVVYLIVRTPRQGAVDLEAHNGPIGLRQVNGRVKARAVNGPISLRDCTGEIDVETRNGPIDWSGGGGNVRLKAKNGPLSVKLTGARWTGGTLEGDTQNGPLSLRVPEDYSSGVRVDASEHSPVSCHAAACGRAMRTWATPSRIEIGSQPPAVKLSTVNGPVEIK